MQRSGIPTEASGRNREIREQDTQPEQMETQLTRLNAWPQHEINEALIARGVYIPSEVLAEENENGPAPSLIVSKAV